MASFISNSFITLAGMPSLLPLAPETYQRLSESYSYRLQAISFFAVGLLLCSALVAFLWNYTKKDFPQLPSLSFRVAFAATTLWGLLFVIVLTMISGARELMTPGAWKKNGYTYSLSLEEEAKDNNGPRQLRKRHLEKLRTALWHFAATHQGQFPDQNDYSAIADATWQIPQASGTHYILVEEQSANAAEDILAYEPELELEERMVLFTNGEIRSLNSSEIQANLER